MKKPYHTPKLISIEPTDEQKERIEAAILAGNVGEMMRVYEEVRNADPDPDTD